MQLPSMQTLRGVAVVTALAGISGCVYLQIKATDNIGQSPFFREAFKILRADESARKLLGQPIRQLGFDITNKDNHCDGKHAQYHVRVRGPNDKGMLYFWADANEERKWKVNRMELELNKYPGKRLAVKVNDSGPDSVTDAPVNDNSIQSKS